MPVRVPGWPVHGRCDSTCSDLSDETISDEGMVLAVSLDIANALNTLSWECIRQSGFQEVSGLPPEQGYTLPRAVWGDSQEEDPSRGSAGISLRRSCGTSDTIRSSEAPFFTSWGWYVTKMTRYFWPRGEGLGKQSPRGGSGNTSGQNKVTGPESDSPKDQGRLICRVSSEGAVAEDQLTIEKVRVTICFGPTHPAPLPT